MDLLTPGIGLIFWQALVFLLLVFILGRYAWRPILGAIDAREQRISKALSLAEASEQKVLSLEKEQQRMLAASSKERETLLNEARALAEQIRQKASDDTEKIAKKMLEEARLTITREEGEAQSRLRDFVVSFSLQLSERLLKERMKDGKEAERLLRRYLAEIKA